MSKWNGSFLITKVFLHWALELENKEGVFTVNGQRIKTNQGMHRAFRKLIRPIILINSKKSRVVCRAMKLNQTLLGRKPKVYPLSNDRFCFPCINSHFLFNWYEYSFFYFVC